MPPQVASSRTRLALITPLRLALGVAALGGALAGGAVGDSALASFALGIGQDVLAALLGGAEAGMALAGAIAFVQLVEWERREGARLMVEIGPRGRLWVSPGQG